MKRFVASVAIVLSALSMANAQDVRRQGDSPDLAGVIGSTIGALVGSTIGDGRGQILATNAGAPLGSVVGESLPPLRPAAGSGNALVQDFDNHRSQMIEAAVSGRIPIPRKAKPVYRRYGLTHCQKIELGTFACQDNIGTWHVAK